MEAVPLQPLVSPSNGFSNFGSVGRIKKKFKTIRKSGLKINMVAMEKEKINVVVKGTEILQMRKLSVLKKEK